MGTPDFAVPSLRSLVESRHTVAGVVTVPDKPRGRGQRVRPSAVKKFATQYGLPVYQPEKLDDPDFLEIVESLQLDLMVVVAFRILPQSLYSIPAQGAINLHASLLPKYRGAAPIQHAIMNGEPETGVTTFFLKPSVDTGDILLQESIEIGPDETAGSVHDRLAELGAEVVLKTVTGIAEDSITPSPQDDSEASPAPKIRKKHRTIHWDTPASEVHNHIRALSPYPGAVTQWQGDQLKILRGHVMDKFTDDGDPGSVVSLKDDTIGIACARGIYGITELQPAGKRRMKAEDFLNGYTIEIGEQLG